MYIGKVVIDAWVARDDHSNLKNSTHPKSRELAFLSFMTFILIEDHHNLSNRKKSA